MGTYNADGELWTCEDHDICNGTFIDGNYVYLSTTTFPYILGCFGPGTAQEYAVTCSSSSCPESSFGSGAISLQSVTALAATLLALLAF